MSSTVALGRPVPAAGPADRADVARADDGADGTTDRSLPGPAVGLLGLARLGAGLVAVAAGAEHLRDAGAPWGVGLVVLGVVIGVRGLLDVRRRRTPGPREAALLGGAGGAWAAAATSGAVVGGVPHVADGADAALVTLLLGSAAVAAACVRSGRPVVAGGTAHDDARTSGRERAAAERAEVPAGPPTGRAPGGRPVMRLVGWAGSALVVAAVTAGGLASTEAGRHAVPHGDHGVRTTVPPTDPAGGHPGH